MTKKHIIQNIIEFTLVKNQSIQTELIKIIKEHKIKTAFYSGIGAGKNLIIGFMKNTDPVEYKTIKCDSDYEITAFNGNIQLGKSHTHITLSNNIANGIGGHFFEGTVAYVFQLYISVLEYY